MKRPKEPSPYARMGPDAEAMLRQKVEARRPVKRFPVWDPPPCFDGLAAYLSWRELVKPSAEDNVLDLPCVDCLPWLQHAMTELGVCPNPHFPLGEMN